MSDLQVTYTGKTTVLTAVNNCIVNYTLVGGGGAAGGGDSNNGSDGLPGDIIHGSYKLLRGEQLSVTVGEGGKPGTAGTWARGGVGGNALIGYAGGEGGRSGNSGTSGSGGGGGGATVLKKTSDNSIIAIAAGGGGGGGGGNYSKGFIKSTEPYGQAPRQTNNGLVANWTGLRPDATKRIFVDECLPEIHNLAFSTSVQSSSFPGKPSFPSMVFNGTSSSYAYIEQLVSNDQLQLTRTKGSSFTIEAWVYLNGVGSHSPYGGEIINKDSDYEVAIMRDGRVTCAFDWGVGTDRNLPGSGWIIPPVGTAVVAQKTATHVAVVVDNTVLKIYLNGILAWTKNDLDRVATASGSRTYVGNRPGQTQAFNGHISCLRVWEVARTHQEILDNIENIYVPVTYSGRGGHGQDRGGDHGGPGGGGGGNAGGMGGLIKYGDVGNPSGSTGYSTWYSAINGGFGAFIGHTTGSYGLGGIAVRRYTDNTLSYAQNGIAIFTAGQNDLTVRASYVRTRWGIFGGSRETVIYWQYFTDIMTKINSVFTKVKEVYVKDSGVWKRVYGDDTPTATTPNQTTVDNISGIES